MSVGMVAFLFGLAAFLAVYAMFAPIHEVAEDDPYERILHGNTETTEEDAPAASGSSFDRILMPMVHNILPQTPMGALTRAKESTWIRELLVRSGNPWNIRPEEFLGVQMIAAGLGFLLGLFMAVEQMIPDAPPWAVMLGGAGLGAYVPYMLLSSKKAKRQRGARRGLPEALDLLRITMKAGQTFDPALEEVSKRLPDGIVKDELVRVVADRRSGTTTTKALASLARRSPTPEVESFCRAVQRAQRIGADLTETLQLQSEAARSAYEAAINKKIASIETKIMIAIMVTMLPSLFIAILAPAFASIGTAFG